VWQAGQAEASVADADPPAFISHHLCGNVHQRTLLFWYHKTGTFSTVDQHQTVEIVGSVAAVHFVLMSNPSDNLLTGLRRCQLWG
jgi:hypothetical protein